jgi:phage terminase small subunit
VSNAVSEPQPLSPKQRRFVEAYLVCWNASEAARVAEYAWPYKAGPNLTKLPAVQAAIQERLAEAAMRADEVLARLAEQARIDLADFMLFEDEAKVDDAGQPVLDELGNPVIIRTFAGLNWKELEKRGHLVKKLSYDRNGRPVIEFHDAQQALIQIGRHLKLFTDNVNLNAEVGVKGFIGVSPDDWDETNEQE